MMAYLQQTAAQEVELARQEEAAAREARFAELVERRSRFVFRVCYALVRNLHDAEDVVQEVFLKLYRSGAWERMEDEQGFLARTAWRIAETSCRNIAAPPPARIWLPWLRTLKRRRSRQTTTPSFTG